MRKAYILGVLLLWFSGILLDSNVRVVVGALHRPVKQPAGKPNPCHCPVAVEALQPTGFEASLVWQRRDLTTQGPEVKSSVGSALHTSMSVYEVSLVKVPQ